MAERRARYVGPSQTGVDVVIPLSNGESRPRHVPHGGEIPREIDGGQVPAAYIDSLLEQADNWTEVKRPTGPKKEGE